MAEVRKALELDPLSAVMHHQAGQTYQQARHYDQAILEYQNAIALDPGFLAPSMFMSLAYQRSGKLEKAAEAMTAAFPAEKAWTSALVTAANGGDMQGYLRKEREIAPRLARPAYYHALYEAAAGNDAAAPLSIVVSPPGVRRTPWLRTVGHPCRTLAHAARDSGRTATQAGLVRMERLGTAA